VASSIRKELALTSLASGGRSVGIVRLRTEAMEFFFIYDINLSFCQESLYKLTVLFDENVIVTARICLA
jgi:hypothetical protein